jgi:hypothetical protein
MWPALKTKDTAAYVFSKTCDKFGDTPLDRLDKIELQKWLNDLSEKWHKTAEVSADQYMQSVPESVRRMTEQVYSVITKEKTPEEQSQGSFRS